MKAPRLKFVIMLFVYTIMTGFAYGADSDDEMRASGQPFVHPSDDASYSNDMRDDEMLAKTKPVNTGNVQYVSGGIAVSGMRAIDAEEHAYNLKMLFVGGADGEYLADVAVNIENDKGKTFLSTTANGPVLLVKLPPGNYTVSAQTSNGDSLTQHVNVGSDHLASYVLRCPAKNQ
jgi:hypothetical protein